MDAVQYLKEKKRMCEKSSCMYCSLGSTYRNSKMSCDIFIGMFPEEAVATVEQWSKEHPIMTNKMKFEEVFGNTCDENGELVLVRPSWWSAEYKAPKGEE